MPFTDQEYMSIGARFSTQRLIEQLGVAIATAKEHQAELARRWPADKTAALAKLADLIHGLYDEQAERKFQAATGNVNVHEIMREAKVLIGDIIAAADSAFADEPTIADQFHKGGKLGVSVPKVSGRLQALLVHAADHKDALAPWGIGDDDLQRGNDILVRLGEANAAQEQALRNLPPKTRELYVAKGRAYLLLKALNRAAKRSFIDDPTTAAKLDLRVLNRHGRRAKEPAPTPEPAPVA